MQGIAIVITLIHSLASGQADWAKYVHRQAAVYEQWSQDTDSNDRGRWLNDKLVCLAYTEPTNKDEVKQIVYIIALYDEWNEPLPESAQETIKKYKGFFQSMNMTEKITLDNISNRVLVGLGKQAPEPEKKGLNDTEQKLQQAKEVMAHLKF